MKNIRKSVFETNSSSTHSISIAEGDYIADTMYVDEEGVCSVYPGEFGWEVESYCNAESKASYCLTYAKKYDANKVEMLRNVIQEVTGAKSVKFLSINGIPDDAPEDPSKDPYYEWGYIDHQSNHTCSEAFGSESTLKDFIFNRNSVLKTDNDNHS